jgi:RNA polymerase sigma-70 factor (ECF subfamily)
MSPPRHDDFDELYRAHGGRRRSDRPVPEPVVAGPSLERIALTQALTTLPPPQRRAVIMYYLGDLSVAEVAEIEGASENTVKQRLHRARAALAERLADLRAEVDHV